MCITHTPHRPLSPIPMGSDLGHFIMPFTCAHTCAKCVLHKLHITHYASRIRHVGRLRKFIQAKSKFRWQINYARNSWPLCRRTSANWLQTRCCCKREKTKNQIVGNSTANIAASTGNGSSSEFNINFNVNSCNWQAKSSLITKSSPKNIFSHSSAGKSCARLIC